MPNSSSKFKYTLFADDSTLSYSFDPRSDLVIAAEVINAEMSKIYNWLLVNKIRINVDKTNYMLFNFNQRTDFPSIHIGNSTISQINKTKFLGVIFDDGLKFNFHTNHTASRVSRTVGLLNRLKHFLPVETMLRLHDSLVMPYLLYAIEIWGGTSYCHLDRVVKAQKSALRSANNLPYNSHTSPIFKHLGILKLPDLYRFRILIMMFKAIYFNTDVHFFNYLSCHSDLHLYSTRNCNNLIIPYYRRTKSQMCISYTGPKLWNALPTSLKNCTSLKVFKISLKKHIIDQY